MNTLKYVIQFKTISLYDMPYNTESEEPWRPIVGQTRKTFDPHAAGG